MSKKPRGKYVEGSEPWTLAGCKETTFNARLKAEVKRGETDGPSHQAKRQALEIAANASGETVEAGVVEQAPVEAPTPIQAPVEAPVEPRRYSPAATLSLPSEPPPPAVAGATKNVTLRSVPAQHDRLRAMSYSTRRPIQDLVSTAVDEYLSRSGY